MPTSLGVGQAAIISYETDVTSVAGGSPDAIRIVLLQAVTSSTVIYLTDRAWNGTSFAAASAGEGTLTITVGPLPAGSILTFTAAQLTAAGISLSNAGETVYLYQGTSADAPTQFLFAADIADGNTTFNGSLVNTGLTNGVNAVAVAHDNAAFVGMPTEIPATLLTAMLNTVSWSGSDQDDIAGTTLFTEVSDTTVSNVFANPDVVLIAGMAGGGQSDAILRIGNDEGANVGSNLTRLFRDNAAFNRVADVTFDLEDGFFFFVDSDGNSINRIMRGNIADLVSGTSTPTFTQIFITDNQNNGAGGVIPGEIIVNMEIDKTTNKIYWMDGDLSGTYEGGFQLWESNYDGTGQRLIQTIDTENTDPNFFLPGGVGDFAVAGGFAYVVSSTGIVDGLGNSTVAQNHILKINLATGALTYLNLGTSPGGYSPGRLDPLQGQIIGIDVNTVTGDVWFVTQPITANDHGGVFKFVQGSLVGSTVNGTLTEIWDQPTNNAFSTLQSFPTANMTHIEVDEIGGRVYISAVSDNDTELDGTPATNESDASIFTLALNAPANTAPTLFFRVFEPTANGSPTGLEIDHAPVTAVTSAAATYTETAGSPSAAGTPVAVLSAATVTDADNTLIQGATLAVTAGFVSGDALAVTVGATGIVATYNATNGVLTLTGVRTLAQYQTVITSLTFTNAGDNPTNFGASTSRTISVTTFDGLANSDPATATVTVVGVNDAPVNTVGGTLNISEDASATALTGISIADVDSNPAATLMTVTFTVGRGIITLNTGVAGGVTAGQITAGANGTATLTVTATQNAINATLANATGLTYTPTANVNGADALTILTSDGGATGTGGTLTDSDNKAISVTAVNDAPVVINGGFVATGIIFEDTPQVNGFTVATLYGGNFSDATDQVTGGSSANTLAGIIVTGNPSSANGIWQYFNGAIWVSIPTGMTAATGFAIAATTAVRFNPTLNFNGASPTIVATLVDSSGGALTTGATVDASVTGGTTRFSSGSVSMSQPVAAVNDAPTSTGLQGDSVTTTEPAGAGSVMSGVNIDSGANMTFADVDNANFNGGTLRFAITAGKDSTQDQLNIDTTGIVMIAAGTISVSGTAIGTVTGGGAGGSDIVITLNANATPALVQSVARFVFFGSTGGDNPTAGARTITTTLIDGGGTANLGVDTLTVTSTVTVVATNDGPTITGLPAGLPAFNPGVPANIDLSASTIADVDSATVTVTLTASAPGTFLTATVAGVTVGGPANAPTLSGTVAAINTYLDTASNVRFAPGLLNGVFSVFVDVSDGTATTGPQGITSSITFTPETLTTGTAVTQSFNNLAISGAGTVTPLGWTFSETNGSVVYTANNGSLLTGDTYSYGTTGAADRAFGSLQSGTNVPTLGAAFTNTSGVTLTSLLISYIGEQWRRGNTGTGADRLDFQISFNATNLTTGTWNDINALDFTGVNTGATATALDGNLAANQTAISSEIIGLQIAPGATVWIRWNSFGLTGGNGADDGLAIDDFSITARALNAVADNAGVLENATITNGNLFANDISQGGAPPLSVSLVNGNAANVGTQIPLASGALLTVNANGTYSYNPNSAFNYLIDATTAAATGATNTSATDTFTYTLAGGITAAQTATVTVTIGGVQSAGDQLRGGAGNDTINGTPLDDFFNLAQGGNDFVTGGAGNDGFFFGSFFTAADTVDGGLGTNDQVGLQGDYSALLTLGAGSLVNVEVLSVLPGFSYNIASIDANVPATQELSVFGGNLLAGNNFSFNGSAETNGRFRMFGGLGNDSFIGGALDDGFYFGPGRWNATDAVVGNGGTNDQLALDGDYSILVNANAGVETLILLPGPGATPNNFNITLDNVWTGAGATKTVWGLNVTTAMTIDGTAETDGNLIFFGGRASDSLYGGAGADAIYGGGGGDFMFGGAGADVFRYDAITDSNGATNATRDRIVDFASGVDKIDLSRIDAITGGVDDAFSFIGTAAFGNVAGQLRYTAAGGNIFIVEGDVDGDGIADFTLSVAMTPATPPVATDFVL